MLDSARVGDGRIGLAVQEMTLQKVFCVGLSKTGTTSLHAALEQLGMRSIHNPESMLSVEGGELCFSSALAAEYDALSDLPIAAFYRELDRAFPGARFILTTRSAEPWLASCANHFDPGAFHPNDVVRRLVERIYGTPVYEEGAFRAAQVRHDSGVREYFAGRPSDLLVIDIDESDKWTPLCRFLGISAPEASYPHENRASGLPQPLKRLARAVKNRLALFL